MLHFVEHTLHHVALGFMAVVYVIRIMWFLRYKAGGDRQLKTGRAGTTAEKGILYSWAIVAMPWAMESSRKSPLFWLQFVFFHLGVVVAISMLFVIPYFPEVLASNAWLVTVFQAFCGVAFLIGVGRFLRRVLSPYMRAISTPDDYFSLLLLTVWFAFAFLAAPNDRSEGTWHILGYFSMATFFLIYVPFSKISHYLYYPFTRFYLGRSLGYRGVYPNRAVPPPKSA